MDYLNILALYNY